ncbi:MAG: glutathione S-transferase C-terminal domain-containing protein, partial [Microcystaceae cyanobacterium]
LNTQFNEWSTQPNLDLYPTSLQAEIDQLTTQIYTDVNNGVYRCGMAQSQSAYESACQALFATLDQLEERLTNNSYLCGEQITLADVWLFPTLFRFDAVYYHLFKCNCRRIQDYPNLWAFSQRIYQLPGVAATCNIKQVKQDYYTNLFPLNPGGIIPLGS